MAIGKSGRLVVEIDPDLKRRLHSALAAESTTLKAWLIDTATEYVKEREQPREAGFLDKKKKPGKRS